MFQAIQAIPVIADIAVNPDNQDIADIPDKTAHPELTVNPVIQGIPVIQALVAQESADLVVIRALVAQSEIKAHQGIADIPDCQDTAEFQAIAVLVVLVDIPDIQAQVFRATQDSAVLAVNKAQASISKVKCLLLQAYLLQAIK